MNIAKAAGLSTFKNLTNQSLTHFNQIQIAINYRLTNSVLMREWAVFMAYRFDVLYEWSAKAFVHIKL